MRNKITGAIGLLLGVFISLPAFLSPESRGIPSGGILMIILGVYYMFFKKPPVDDTPDIAPEDRFNKTDSD